MDCSQHVVWGRWWRSNWCHRSYWSYWSDWNCRITWLCGSDWCHRTYGAYWIDWRHRCDRPTRYSRKYGIDRPAGIKW
jgi:hypothetical protein